MKRSERQVIGSKEEMDFNPVDRPAALVVNTRSRSGEEAFEEAGERLEGLGVSLSATYAVRDPSRIVEAVDSALSSALESGVGEGGILVLGGGDGTVSAVVDHLAHRDVVLGLLPLGTANDFARTLEIPTSVPEACDAIAGGRVVDVDLGLAGDNYYVNVASVGLGVGVTRALSPRMKKRAGALAYPVAAVSAFFRHEPFDARLTFPDEDHKPVELERLLQVAVGNGRFYGGGLAVAPDAGIDDGALDVYAVRLGRSRDTVGALRYLKGGDFIPGGSVSRYRTKRVHLETEPAQHVNIDGEITALAPLSFSVAANALRVIVPEDSRAASYDGGRESGGRESGGRESAG